MKFSDLGLNSIFVKAIEEKGYSEPTPIQAKAIPEILKGKDILLLLKPELEKLQALLCLYYSVFQNKNTIHQDLLEH